MAGIHVDFKVSPEEFAAHLSAAVYQVALEYGFTGSFMDFELEVHRAIREVIRKEMRVSSMCGTFPECQAARRCEPWSEEAKQMFRSQIRRPSPKKVVSK